VSVCRAGVYVKNVATIKIAKILIVHYTNGENNKMSIDKNSIGRSYENPKDFDKEAEQEGVALRKQGQYGQSRYAHIRQQTDNYNKQQLDKLFKR